MCLHVASLCLLQNHQNRRIISSIFITRQSELLGTELNNLLDSINGVILWLEIQEDKDWARHRDYCQRIGGTAACVMRVVTEVAHFKHHHDVNIEDNNDTQYLFIGDSWYGLVKAAVNVKIAGHCVCLMAKTSHSRRPKIFLEETMKYFLGGT